MHLIPLEEGRLKRRGWIALTFLGFFVVAILACGGGGQYGEVKKTMEKAAKVLETLAKEMDQAEDEKAVASALNKFADELVALQPKMDEFSRKYPELQNPENIPSELKEIMDKVEALERDELKSVYIKAKKYSSDPEVANAMQKIQETMK